MAMSCPRRNAFQRRELATTLMMARLVLKKDERAHHDVLTTGRVGRRSGVDAG
jgi:hypothetical protein